MGGTTAAEGSSNEGVRWQRFLASLSEKGYFKVRTRLMCDIVSCAASMLSVVLEVASNRTARYCSETCVILPLVSDRLKNYNAFFAFSVS